MDPTSSLCPSRKTLGPPVGFFKCLKFSSVNFPVCCFALRTLSNWVYEFDKWAPTVVKVSYKVSYAALAVETYHESSFWWDIEGNTSEFQLKRHFQLEKKT